MLDLTHAQLVGLGTAVAASVTIGLARGVLRWRDARRAGMEPAEREALERSDRRAGWIFVAIFAPLCVLGLIVSGKDRAALPALPARPSGVTELVARAQSGSRVILRYRGRWLWARVESGPSHRCTTGRSIDSNYVQGPMRWTGTKTFAMAGTYRTRARITTGGRFTIEYSAPKDVRYRLVGRFRSPALATGSFERSDVVHDGDRVVLSCLRRFRWTAAVAP